MRFSLRVLSYFEAVADRGSVTAAAHALHISQPSLSAAIRELEQALSVTLFVRHHAKGLTLTAAGRQVLAHAKALLAHAADFERVAGAVGPGLGGELKVACFVTLSPFVLPRLCSLVATEHPDIRLITAEADHEDLHAGLRDGTIELGISYLYEEQQDILAVPIGVLPPRVVISSKHPLAKKKRIRLRELRGEPYVLLDLPRTRDYFLSLFRSCGVTPIVRHSSMSYETVRGLVARGEGFSILNTMPATPVTYLGDRIAELEIVDRLPPLQVACLRLKQSNSRASVLTVMEICTEKLGWPLRLG
jgi:DNA-binding transcriptional LysR family regulator